MTVLVTGATGFLGRRVVAALLADGQAVRVMVRQPGSERVFQTPSASAGGEGGIAGAPTEVCYGDVSDPDALAEACRDMVAVIHLVAVIRGGAREFDAVNRQGTANVAAAARGAGSVRRFVQLSALGAANIPQRQYLYSKWQGEQAVRQAGLAAYTIIRPSLIFGPGDEFTTAVASLVRVAPLTPVIGSGNNRLQPIHVDDVARCAVAAARGNLRGNRTVAVGGPEQLSYNAIVGIVAQALGRKGWRVNVPLWAMRPPLAVMSGITPRPPINRAMLQLIALRNVAEPDAVPRYFGFRPRRMAGNLDYLGGVSFGAALRTCLGMPAGR